jgi:hypothetical protein
LIPFKPLTCEDAPVKYMLLIYQNPTAWAALTEDERTAAMSDAGTVMAELEKTGEWVGGAALLPPTASKGVRVRDGAPIVTDGPYIEAKEHLAGYLTVDVASEERAIEIAARWPDARYWGMEVRQVDG